MTHDTRIALFLLGELIYALRANDSDAFRQWLSGGVEDLGEPVVTELLMEWMSTLLSVDEKDRLSAWHRCLDPCRGHDFA
mgnify:CR=1 FL=1